MLVDPSLTEPEAISSTAPSSAIGEASTSLAPAPRSGP